MMKPALKAPSRPESFRNRKAVTFPSLGTFQDKDEEPEMRSAEGFTLPSKEKILSVFQTFYIHFSQLLRGVFLYNTMIAPLMINKTLMRSTHTLTQCIHFLLVLRHATID